MNTKDAERLHQRRVDQAIEKGVIKCRHLSYLELKGDFLRCEAALLDPRTSIRDLDNPIAFALANTKSEIEKDDAFPGFCGAHAAQVVRRERNRLEIAWQVANGISLR
jgi:hypothetical protein